MTQPAETVETEPIVNEETPPEAAPVAPSEPAPTAAPVDDELKKARDRLSEMGRDLATTRQQLDQTRQIALTQTQRTAAMEQQLAKVTSFLSAQQVQALKARVAGMTPEQAKEELARMAEAQEQQLTQRQAQRQAPQPQPVQETPQQYAARRINEILATTSETFELETPLTLEDLPQEALADEATFVRAARRAAKSRITGQGGSTPVAKPAETKTEPKTEDINAQIQAGVKKALAEMGVGGPASPRPAAAGKPGNFTSDDVRGAAASYDSKLGPRANLERLRALGSK